LPEGALPLMRVAGQLPLLFTQVYQKTIASDAIGCDFLTVND